MNKKLTLSISATVTAVSAIFFIAAVNAQAVNSHSIDLESGSSQYLSISDASQTGLDITGNMTFETWAKFESLPASGSFYSFADKWTDASFQHSYIFAYYNDGGTYKFRMYNTSAGTDDTLSWASVSHSLSTGTWYHIAFVYTASTGGVEVFVNGSSVGSASGLTTSVYNSSAPFAIGGNPNTAYFDGLIDDVRIWNIVRTGTEISDDRSRELNGNETGLVGYWKLNNSLSDSTANGNTLTNNNSVTHSTDAAFSGSVAVLKVRKSANESVASSTILQNDDSLKLTLDANKTYIVDGVIFASSTSATPDIKIALFGQSGSDIKIGYTNDVNEMVLNSGEESSRITLPANTPTSIHIKGTVTTGSTSGDFQLKWGQVTASGNPTTVMKGSYLRADEI